MRKIILIGMCIYLILLVGCKKTDFCKQEECIIQRLYNYCEENNCEVQGHIGSIRCSGMMSNYKVIDKVTRKEIEFNFLEEDYKICGR